MIQTIKSVTQVHTAFGLSKIKHPLISVIWAKDFPDFDDLKGVKFSSELFMISLKDGISGSFGYGRNSYDFTEGTMVFTKPGQVYSIQEKNVADDAKGWMLLFHPDLIRKSDFARQIKSYSFFNYEVSEALHLSDIEKKMLTDIVVQIEAELTRGIDRHSQKLLISTIQLILDYCNRYYDRQFYVRSNLNKDVVALFERALDSYFESDLVVKEGIPSIKYFGRILNLSANYLSDLLKKETGKSAKDHVNAVIVTKAKDKLLGTDKSVSQIAFDLGFEYPQYFSKMFKKQVGVSPNQFRNLN